MAWSGDYESSVEARLRQLRGEIHSLRTSHVVADELITRKPRVPPATIAFSTSSRGHQSVAETTGASTSRSRQGRRGTSFSRSAVGPSSSLSRSQTAAAPSRTLPNARASGHCWSAYTSREVHFKISSSSQSFSSSAAVKQSTLTSRDHSIRTRHRSAGTSADAGKMSADLSRKRPRRRDRGGSDNSAGSPESKDVTSGNRRYRDQRRENPTGKSRQRQQSQSSEASPRQHDSSYHQRHKEADSEEDDSDTSLDGRLASLVSSVQNLTTGGERGTAGTDTQASAGALRAQPQRGQMSLRVPAVAGGAGNSLSAHSMSDVSGRRVGNDASAGPHRTASDTNLLPQQRAPRDDGYGNDDGAGRLGSYRWTASQPAEAAATASPTTLSDTAVRSDAGIGTVPVAGEAAPADVHVDTLERGNSSGTDSGHSFDSSDSSTVARWRGRRVGRRRRRQGNGSSERSAVSSGQSDNSSSSRRGGNSDKSSDSSDDASEKSGSTPSGTESAASEGESDSDEEGKYSSSFYSSLSDYESDTNAAAPAADSSRTTRGFSTRHSSSLTATGGTPRRHSGGAGSSGGSHSPGPGNGRSWCDIGNDVRFADWVEVKVRQRETELRTRRDTQRALRHARQLYSEERRRKQEESRQAVDAWMEKKRSASATSNPVRKQGRQSPDGQANDKDSRTYKRWLRKKRQQRLEEMRIEEQRKAERDQQEEEKRLRDKRLTHQQWLARQRKRIGSTKSSKSRTSVGGEDSTPAAGFLDDYVRKRAEDNLRQWRTSGQKVTATTKPDTPEAMPLPPMEFRDRNQRFAAKTIAFGRSTDVPSFVGENASPAATAAASSEGSRRKTTAKKRKDATATARQPGSEVNAAGRGNPLSKVLDYLETIDAEQKGTGPRPIHDLSNLSSPMASHLDGPQMTRPEPQGCA